MDSKLIIIRHARTTTNLRLSDSLDPSITDYGFKQARNVGKFLAKHVKIHPWAGFYTSPFLRCLQTSREISNEINKTREGGSILRRFNVHSAVREYINHGGREVTIPVRKTDYDDMYWSRPEFEGSELYYKDESNEELLNRIHEFYNTCCQNDRHTVVVTHGLPALLLLHVAKENNLNHVPIWDHSIDNCSISLIVNKRAVWHGRNLYNEIEHDPFDTKRPYDVADLLIPKS